MRHTKIRYEAVLKGTVYCKPGTSERKIIQLIQEGLWGSVSADLTWEPDRHDGEAIVRVRRLGSKPSTKARRRKAR